MSDQIGTAVPFTLNPASYAGGRNALFQQNPDGTFTDVAAELDVQNAAGRSLGALWHDFDQDGWLDLYVANDVSDNVFYRNTGGRFQDVSHAAWIADYRSAMGLAAADFDRDGDDDLFVTHWVAQENALYENMLADFKAKPGQSTGSSRLISATAADSSPPAKTHSAPLSNLRFVDIANQKGLGPVALPFVGWGTEFVDLDHDGWLDLWVANGSTIEADGMPPKPLQPQSSFLFWNQQGRFFHNLAVLHPGLTATHVSRGLACADFDNDGDQDCVIADLGEGVRLYRNDMASGNWLKLRLRSRDRSGLPRGFGDGSIVTLWITNTPLRRSVSRTSYLSQSSHTLHWGLGSEPEIDRVEVRWHGGSQETYGPLAANATYEIREGDPAPLRLSITPIGSEIPDGQPTSAPGTGRVASPVDERQRVRQFWTLHRSAMDAMKIERDHLKAIQLFREALVLNPTHEDAHYYLGLCLATLGDTEGALTSLQTLQDLNPQSHRAWQQWGLVRAASAVTDDALAAAEQALLRAHTINPEETGALLALGEVSLLRGDSGLADRRLGAATHTNPKAAGGFFLRGYLAWKRGEAGAAEQFLKQARAALGPDWQPRGTTSEGDVKRKHHVEGSLLARFWEAWDGRPAPELAFQDLDAELALRLE
jgi:tetratricopeptide (TPR) repeat protein